MKLLICVFLLSLGINSYADQELSVAVGLRGDSADAETSGYDVSGKANFQAGGLVHLPLFNDFKARLGALYTRRGYTVTNNNNALQAEPDLSYFDFPFGFQVDFSEAFSAFLGGDLALNIVKEKATGVNTLPVFVQLGGSFKINSSIGVEVYYEQGISKIADQVKDARAFVGQFVFTF